MQINLMYHDVYAYDSNESGFLRERDFPYKMKLETFEEHVHKIHDYCELHKLPRNHVVFSFDDGGKSFYTIIAPILEKYGYKGIFFITTKYINTNTFLSESEILSLHQRGHIIGTHAHTHEHLYTLSDEDIENEWKQSIDILSKIIDTPIIYASIPNGDTSKRVLDNAKKYGIKYIYTSEPTTKISYFKGMEIIGRYVLFATSTTDYVLSIITSSRKRFMLSCKRSILKVFKTLLGGYYVKLKNLLFR